jgi:hypothetical protein
MGLPLSACSTRGFRMQPSASQSLSLKAEAGARLRVRGHVLPGDVLRGPQTRQPNCILTRQDFHDFILSRGRTAIMSAPTHPMRVHPRNKLSRKTRQPREPRDPAIMVGRKYMARNIKKNARMVALIASRSNVAGIELTCWPTASETKTRAARNASAANTPVGTSLGASKAPQHLPNVCFPT